MIFLAPLHLLLLLFPIIFLYISLKNSKIIHKNIFSQRVLKRITLYPNLENTPSYYRLFLVSMSLFIIALAQPVLNYKNINESHFTPLVIALDISKSMSLTDVYPNRLSFAKKKIDSILDKYPNLRVSLLLFSRDAYLAYPMSEDFSSLKYLLNNLDQNFKSGSNLFAALEGSKQILRKYKSKNILLLSDGTSSHDFTQEKIYLKDNNLTLNILYISKNSSQEKEIQNLSLSSGGVFKKFSFGDNDIRFLIHEILKHSQTRKDNSNILEEKKKIQLFYYPLLLALLLLLFIFLKKYEFKRVMSMFFILLSLNFPLFHTELHAGVLAFKNIRDAKEYYNFS